MEMKIRSLLDRTLPVRPRTKEFLIGHPAFVLALALWFRGRRRWAAPLLVVGVVGQVSMLNTFCHVHTPLYLSLVRVVTGLALGAALGWAAFRVIEMVARDGPRG
jgi:peptidoglycan/LPS O-acetylase OafA/YrhL